MTPSNANRAPSLPRAAAFRIRCTDTYLASTYPPGYVARSWLAEVSLPEARRAAKAAGVRRRRMSTSEVGVSKPSVGGGLVMSVFGLGVVVWSWLTGDGAA